ncbi:MAG: gliding motility-associated C-terminal domain-containing protein [Chitinophagales bacterium]
MHKLYTTLLIGISIISSVQAQTFELFTEDFNTPTASFLLNTPGPGTGTGTNQWVINNSYTGGFGYPNTTTQDITAGGTIGGAPTSTYLHVYDLEGAPAVTCASYDPTDPSDNFAEMAYGFCTLGLVDIEFTFFYLCEGSPGAYGQVYYSADGGPWTACGEALYNDQNIWKYEVITQPEFEDVADLRFGFRWINDGGGGSSEMSFAIDDIIAVGTYDEAVHAVDINIDFLFPDPVCKLSTIIVGWSLTDPLCEGTYEIRLSNAAGVFAPGTSLGVFTILAEDTAGAIAAIIPGAVPDGSCYKVRINRTSPLPTITGMESDCFTIESCPNTITTLPPVVTFDTNAVCVNSVIDVPFYSTGVFLAGNVYTAELSDSTGSFDSPSVIGTFFSSATFDPALGSPPGTVSGIVPVVPPGCNYYIRVTSSSPAVVGSVYGPICIQECDIETNDIEDVWVCISEEVGDTITITYDTNVFDDIETYCDTNTFCVEILDAMFFTQANLCGLGFTVDTESGTIDLEIPGYFDLLALGLDAGVWYMRIIANCGTPSENQLGTLVHLIIGAPADNPPVIIPTDTLLCEGSIGSALVVPYNPNSDYQFQFDTGTPFIWPYNPIFINFAGVTGDITLRVREISYECPGPWSEYVTFHIIDVPIVSISGPPKACTGDTTYYSVPYFLTTYYDWSVSGGTIVDTANNEIGIVWDEAGTYTISIFALNMCGSGTGTKTITVITTTYVDGGDDATICDGQAAIFNALTTDIYDYTWYNASDNSVVGSDFYFNIYPDTTTTYYVLAEDENGCQSWDTVVAYVEYPTFEYDSTTYCIGGNTDLDAGYPGSAYAWNTGETDQSITVNAPGDYSVVIQTPEYACVVTKLFHVEEVIDNCDPIINVPNAFSPNGDGFNDNLLITGAAIVDFEIQIFNRWGEMVFQSSDLNILNNASLGWDGRYKNEDQEMGSYVYYIYATGGSGKTVSLQGNITLVR